MGSAVGVPIVAVLGPGGFLSGSKFDSLKVFGTNKSVTISIPKEFYARIVFDAKGSEQVSSLSERIIEKVYEESI